MTENIIIAVIGFLGSVVCAFVSGFFASRSKGHKEECEKIRTEITTKISNSQNQKMEVNVNTGIEGIKGNDSENKDKKRIKFIYGENPVELEIEKIEDVKIQRISIILNNPYAVIISKSNSDNPYVWYSKINITKEIAEKIRDKINHFRFNKTENIVLDIEAEVKEL